MKIRSGFVSNSSSSSFCIYGASIDVKEVEKAFGVEDADSIDLKKELGEGFHLHYGDPNDDYSDNVYVGVHPGDIKDEQTGKEFRDSIQAKLSEKIGKKVKCSIIEMGWYDG